MKALNIINGYLVQDCNNRYFLNSDGSLRKYQGINDNRCHCEMSAKVCCKPNGDIDHFVASFSEQGFRYQKSESFATIEESSNWLMSQYKKIKDNK